MGRVRNGLSVFKTKIRLDILTGWQTAYSKQLVGGGGGGDSISMHIVPCSGGKYYFGETAAEVEVSCYSYLDEVFTPRLF